MRIILSTIPPDRADEVARLLVEEKLAACVSVLPSVRSIYVWQGKMEREEESLLLVKTSRRAARRCSARLRELHPYDVPEIVEVRPTRVLAPYLSWVRSSVS